MAEHHGAEHHLFGQARGFGLDHEHRLRGAGDDQVQLRLGEFLARRVQQVLAVLVTDARGADGARERHAGQRQRGRGADQRRNVGVDVRIQRDHRGHDLHFIEEAVREQRTDRAIDEARGQRFLFGRPAFALEEAAGDATRGVGLLDVVDGQREEVLARHRLLGGDRGDQDDGVAHRDHHRGRGLAGDFAGFDGDGVLTELK